METIEIKILNFLSEICKGNEFKVVSFEDVLAVVSDFTIEDVIETIKSLEDDKYIKIKFMDAKDVCLQLLKRPLATLTEEVEPQQPKKQNFTLLIILFITLSIIGGIIGGLITKLF